MFGAIVLALLLPVLRPVVLSFGPAEFFLLAILGITFIATLSGDSLIKGLIVGCFGLMLAFVGLDPMTGIADPALDEEGLARSLSGERVRARARKGLDDDF